MSFQIAPISPMARYVTVSGVLSRTANDVLLPSSRAHPFLNSIKFTTFSEVVNSAGHTDWLTAQGAPDHTGKSDPELKKILTPELVSAFFASAAQNRDLVSAIVRHEQAMRCLAPLFENGDFERAGLICSRLGLPEHLDDNVTDVHLVSAITAFSVAPPQR